MILYRFSRIMMFCIPLVSTTGCGSQGSGTSGGGSSCAAVCAHGRGLNCSRCFSSTCEQQCESDWSDEIRGRMLATESCRVSYNNGDTADQCRRP